MTTLPLPPLRLGLLLAGIVAATGLLTGCASPAANGASPTAGERVYTDWYSPDAVALPPPPNIN